MAHSVNSRQRSTSVAFGAKRTLTEPHLRKADLRVHALNLMRPSRDGARNGHARPHRCRARPSRHRRDPRRSATPRAMAARSCRQARSAERKHHKCDAAPAHASSTTASGGVAARAGCCRARKFPGPARLRSRRAGLDLGFGRAGPSYGTSLINRSRGHRVGSRAAAAFWSLSRRRRYPVARQADFALKPCRSPFRAYSVRALPWSRQQTKPRANRLWPSRPGDTKSIAGCQRRAPNRPKRQTVALAS